jgi:serine/threonine protein kinase
MVAAIKSTNCNVYKVVRPLGAGTFGTFTVSEQCSAPPSAGTEGFQSKLAQCVLRAPLARQSLEERFVSVQELSLMQQLSHRNLIMGIDSCVEGMHASMPAAHLPVEFCGGGNLSVHLASRNHIYMPESEIRILFAQV